MVFDRLLHEGTLHLLELVGVNCREVCRETEIVFSVVQFPFVIGDRSSRLHFPWRSVHGARQPAVLVDAPISKDLKILNCVAALRPGVIERVYHADALNGDLNGAIHHLRFGQACGFQNGRRDVNNVMKLRSDFSARLDSLRVEYDERVAGTAET